MPVITLFISPNLPHPPKADDYRALQAACRSLCITLLNAHPDKVQVQTVALCHEPQGSPIYVEVKYRDQRQRNAQVMADFMLELEQAIHHIFRLSEPRIRCFPQSNDALYARN